MIIYTMWLQIRKFLLPSELLLRSEINLKNKVELRVGSQTKPREFKKEMLQGWQYVLDVTKLEAAK